MDRGLPQYTHLGASGVGRQNEEPRKVSRQGHSKVRDNLYFRQHTYHLLSTRSAFEMHISISRQAAWSANANSNKAEPFIENTRFERLTFCNCFTQNIARAWPIHNS